MAVAGAIFGAAIGGWMNDRIGRKLSIMCADVLFFIGALIMAFAPAPWVIIIGRLFVGLGIGMASMTAPLYISEDSPARIRGALVSTNGLLITGGQFLSYLVHLAFTKTPGMWRWMLGVAGIPPMIQFIFMWSLPESPRWLYRNNKVNEATQILEKIYPADEVEKEIKALQLSIEEEKRAEESMEYGFFSNIKIAWGNKVVRRGLYAGITVQVAQQFVGINTVLYYSPTVVQLAGYASNKTALALSLITSGLNAAGTIISMLFVDKCGRRRFMIISMFGIIICLLNKTLLCFYSFTSILAHKKRYSSEPPSNSTGMANDDWPDWLPGDWSVHIRKIDGRKVKCYVDPAGHKCYSKPQVLDYLKKTNRSAPVEKTQNVDDSGIDLSVDPNEPHTDEVPESSAGGHPTKLTPRTSRRKPTSTASIEDLSEDFLAGEGSSSAHLSHQRHRGDSSWLPAGWTVEERTRKGGSSSGMKYKIYTDPVGGHRFFSKPQVLNYLAKTNSSAGGQEAIFPEPISAMPISAWQEKPTTEPDDSQIYEATEVDKKTEKKTESSHSSSAYEVISRTPVEGLPEGWIKEVRMRKNGLTKRHDPYFLDPLSEYAFCSKKDALRYLESGDVKTCASKPRKKDMNNDDTLNVNLTSNGGELTPPPDQSRGTEASKEVTNGSVEELKTNGSGVEDPKPLRSITGGSFSTPDTTRKEARSTAGGSFSTPTEDSDWLPDGWLVDVRYKNSGMKYKIYKDPSTGKLFYSKPQVLSYLGLASSSNSRKRKEHKASVAPDSSPNATPADVARPKRSVKKKGDSQNADYQEVITTAAADGLPPGWIKETRTKIYATHKRNDPFYTDPETGYIFRSKLDALRFLETRDVNLCAIRPKVKDKDGNEVLVFTNNVPKPTTGDEVATEENHTPDPKTTDNTKRRVSSRVTKHNSPPSTSPARSSKRQKGKHPETSEGLTEGNGAGQEKLATGVNLEKQPDDGNLTFDIPEDDNWTDQCIDFAVKTLTNEILFNGQPISGGFQEENSGVETTGVKDTPPTKVN
ncbi:hypothetical protein L1987_25765 [Smallanthus sonchifolius]|uniref:Uncharacterized protein n=1 Tax=Smallanthus sonchifolius TaxID=185202 RepID=A0ACB9I9Z4_9ASTR|nr:hypothetical protein L1987_25765 [Smallanthus sonchifolius]